MAQADLKLEQLKNVLTDLQKALECAICLAVVKKPFKLCSRGHLVCVKCLETIESCPTCKGELQQENPVCIQSLLECLPRGCRYSADGCEEMIREGDDHERFCGFRSVKCDICSQNRLVIDLHKHINTVHSEWYTITDEEAQFSWPDYTTEKTYRGLYVFLFSKMLCIFMNNRNRNDLKITFKSIPIGKPDGDYYAKITFEKDNISYVFTIKAFPVEDDNEDSEMKAEYCMKVPKNMLSNFIDKEGDLQCSLVVFKL